MIQAQNLKDIQAKMKRLRKAMVDMVKILINKMHISHETINKKKIFPTIPYQRKNSREFLNAVKTNNLAQVRLLVKYTNRFLVFDYDDCRQSGLIWACKSNYTHLAMFLIDNFSRVDWQDISGRTALHFAVRNNNFTLVKKLLAH